MEIVVIEPVTIEDFKKSIKANGKNTVVKVRNIAIVRKMLELGGFLGITGIEGKEHRSIRQINSGFNEVLARIAAKNRVAIGFDISELESMQKKEKAETLSKWIQNIRLARKSGVKLFILNSKDSRDSLSLLTSLGASTQQTKETMVF